MPAKRKAASAKAAAAPAPATKQSKQKGQKSVKHIIVPVDEGFRGPPNAVVHIDGDVIYDANLNQSNVSNNNNKFYRLQVIKSGFGQQLAFHTATRWGRVGEFGSVSNQGPFADLDGAIQEFEKKFKSKTGLSWEDRLSDPKSGKYTYIERSYEDDEEDTKAEEGDGVKLEKDEDGNTIDPNSKLPKATQRLIELIFNANHFNAVLEQIGYDQQKLPLGKLGDRTIKKGFEHLKELSSLIRHPKLAGNKYNMTQNEALEDFTNKYYSTIPHAFGRTRPPLIRDQDILQKEVAMLDTLTDMSIANDIMKTTTAKSQDTTQLSMLDKRFKELKCDELAPVAANTGEYQRIKDYLINTNGKTHNIRYRLMDVFRVKRAGEADRFEKSEFSKRPDTCRRLLWHGSRTTNFGGILSQGLRIAPPEAPVNGYAFAKGVYHADISSKSANYCQTGLSGGHGLLLLCEVECGNKMWELYSGNYKADEDCKKAGCIATLGKGKTIPAGWVDAECINKELKGVLMPDVTKDPIDVTNPPGSYLQYNEYIAYDVSQIRLRYLLRFSL